MAELDPELRDKIIETHTLVKRIDEDHKEHKIVMNARLRDARLAHEKHQLEVKETFEKHDIRLEKSEHFRTCVVAYAGFVAVLGAAFLELVLTGVKKFWWGA